MFGAYFSEAIVGRAIDTGANVTGAFMGGAIVAGANVGGANVGGANVGGANVAGANVSEHLSRSICRIFRSNCRRSIVAGAYVVSQKFLGHQKVTISLLVVLGTLMWGNKIVKSDESF